jgi:hypothetical protein
MDVCLKLGKFVIFLDLLFLFQRTKIRTSKDCLFNGSSQHSGIDHAPVQVSGKEEANTKVGTIYGRHGKSGDC